MKWPWQKRAERAEREAVRAEREAEGARRDWNAALAQAGESRQHRAVNGFTEDLLDLLSTRRLAGRKRHRSW